MHSRVTDQRIDSGTLKQMAYPLMLDEDTHSALVFLTLVFQSLLLASSMKQTAALFQQAIVFIHTNCGIQTSLRHGVQLSVVFTK